MIRNRVLLKSVTAFFILETIFNTVAPSISWALTAGPTAPEATSFEPVDTTDMVNLATGDLAYNIPLLEVPGPSGGYPLSLSYHAGIQPNEDASWTGLGFTLNPGAIVRSVNGFADDHSDVSNSSRYFWKGGETTSYSVGVSVGIAGTPASVSAGLSYSQDTYMGCGVGAQVGLGPTMGVGSHVTVGVSPYGDPYASAGTGVSVAQSQNGAMSLSGEVGIRTNFKSVTTYAEASMGLGPTKATISTSSQGTNVTLGISGATYTSNRNAGRVSNSSMGFTIPVPIFYGVSIALGYDYQRYWIDELDDIKVNGALNYPTPSDPNTILNMGYFEKNAYDTYSILDSEIFRGSGKNSDPDKVLGGSFPNYDNYFVHAQGLFGAMRPYYYQKHLYKRNNYTRDSEGHKNYQTVQYDLARNQSKDNRRAEFRFINDFSNRFEYTPGEIQHGSNEPGNGNMQYNFSSGTGLKMGEGASSAYTSNQISGSRNVLWFTNEEIIAKDKRVTDAGFIETRATGFVRDDKNNLSKRGQIGGYTITNESGVKYHFALPAYSYDDYLYSEKKGGDAFNEFYKREHYAYTWYLTAVTGPDFVDRGPDGTADGILNEYDWGYWVEFEYGRWTDIYAWRNPSENMNSDIDTDFQNFSEGRKELYYLDAIKTKTHTALFFKDIRDDAKSSLYFLRNYMRKFGIHTKRKETINALTKTGGFIPKTATCECDITYQTYGVRGEPGELRNDKGTIGYFALPTSTLKLNSIVLVENKDLAKVPLSKASGPKYSQNFSFSWSVSKDDMPADKENCDFSSLKLLHHQFYNVLDIYDYEKVASQVKDVTIRKTEFETDYSLTPETANSFDSELIGNSPSFDESVYTRHGKLTLKSLKFLGKQEADLIPAMKFNYELEAPVAGAAGLNIVSGETYFNLQESGLSEGDIISFNSNNKDCYAVVMAITGDKHLLKIIGKNIPVAGYIGFKQTKNPPYDKDATDVWGMFKSDYINTGSKFFDKLVSRRSSKSVDVWSLRSVQLPTGSIIHINYESDEYKKAAIHSNYDFEIRDITQTEEKNVFKIRVWPPINYPNKILDIGSTIQLTFLYDKVTVDDKCKTTSAAYNKIFNGTALIKEKVDGYIILESADLEQNFRSNTRMVVVPPVCFVGLSYTFKYGHVYQLNKLGGGIRVASVRLSNGTETLETSYDYNYNNNASGITSYEPDFGLKGMSELYDPKLDALLGDGYNLLSNSREVPAPGVIYEYVTVREKVLQAKKEYELPNYTTYNFEVFNTGLVGVQYGKITESQFNSAKYDDIGYAKKESRNISLKDYTSRIGSLKSIRLYNKNNELVSTTENHYLHDGITPSLLSQGNDPAVNDDFESNVKFYEAKIEGQFNSQGILEETFTDARFISRPNTDFALQGIISKREQFPAIMTGQTVTNYKTGIKTSTVNKAFDYYSGKVVETISYDAYGNAYHTEVTPAYRQYHAMGLAASGGKNMLIQEAASYTYKIDPSLGNKKLGLVSASVQTWSDQIIALQPDKYLSEARAQQGIWRMSANYTFVGNDDVPLRLDGLYPADNVSSFKAWNLNDPIAAEWQKNTGITLYDVNSHALEAVDLNGDSAATKMSFDQTRVTATATNAAYHEFGYSDAEERPLNDFFGNGVFHNSNEYTSTAHTGSKALVASANARGFTFYMVPKQRTYRVSVWSSQPLCKVKYKFNFDISEHDAPVKNKGKAGTWYLLEADIPVTESKDRMEIWCEAGVNSTFFDDFRVRPVNASMTSYVYNKWGELSYILDNNHLYTKYSYDGMGRLQSTFKESFQSGYGIDGIVKTADVNYNYGKKNPYMVSINAFATGLTGYVYPGGVTQVEQGGQATFEIRKSCSSPRLESVEVDGKPLKLNQEPVVLQDGTRVSGTGGAVRFANVQSAHSLKVIFRPKSAPGTVECESSIIDGKTCYSGGYRYAYYDACGNIGAWHSVASFSSLPVALQPYATQNCCQFNDSSTSNSAGRVAPGSCGCQSKTNVE